MDGGRKIRFRLTLALLISLGVVLLFPASLGVAQISAIGSGGNPLLLEDISDIPESLAQSARQLASELFGEYPEKGKSFTSELLATYKKAEENDVVIFFNSGGWGWNLAEASPGWLSILSGIQVELRMLGYKSLVLNYRRTENNLIGQIDEFASMVTLYPEKARGLAYLVKFLTENLPDLKVILAGESNGSVICDMAMNMLKDNPRVFSIQTGPPFWHKQRAPERSLVLTNSGFGPDVFSEGDLFAMLAASLEDLFGFPKGEANSGHIMYYIGAPGHDYRWYYPGVYTRIVDFLHHNFEPKWQ